MTIYEYLMYRFIENNHPKYHKYCMQWLERITIEQLIYFEREKQNLNL